jgi:hypothetical protein
VNAQALTALKRANEIRVWRAGLKQDLADGASTLAAILREDDPRLSSMQVRDLLKAVPGLGTAKVRRALDKNHLAPSTRVGNLSPRRREELLTWLVANHHSTIRGRIA